MSEHIGDAHVDVTLEGDGPLSKRARKKLEKEIREAGNTAGQQYAKGLDEGQAAEQKKSAANIKKAFSQASWKKLGEESGSAFGKGTRKTMLTELDKLNKERLKRVKANQRQELVDWDLMFRELNQLANANAKAMTAVDRERARERTLALKQLADEEKAANADRVRQEKEVERELTAAIKRVAVAEKGLSDDRRRRAKADAKAELADWQSTYNALVKESSASHKERIRIQKESEVKLVTSYDRIALSVGRAFGKGSRNDVVNFFGGVAEGGFRMVSLIPRLVGGVSNFAKTATGLFEAGSGIRGVFTAIAGAAKGGAGGLASFGSALATAAIAIPVVVVVIGTLVAAMSLLLGIVTALAASLTFALAGGLVAIAGLLLPVAAGVGVLVAAVTSLSDAQKDAIKSAIRPFVDGMRDIGRSAAEAIFGGERFTKTIKDMTAGLASSEMKTLVTDIANAIGDVGAGWAEAINSDGFRNWLTAIGKTVPDQIRNLGATARNIIGGLGGFFLAAQPFISSFTQWLERITGEFSKWANGDGREEIVRFLDRAKESAKAVGGFLGEVVGLIGDLFSAGKDTGDSIFKDMENAVRDFRKYIEDGKLEQWFADAKDFADDLGDALKGLGKVFDALDTAVTRITASGAFQVLATLLQGIATAAEFVITSVGNVAGVLLGMVGTVIEGLGELGGLIGKIPGVPDSFGESWRAAGQKVKELGNDLGGVTTSSANSAAAFEASGNRVRADATNTETSVGRLFGGLQKLNAPFTAQVGENGVPVTQTKTLSLFESLKKVDAPFLARVSESGAPVAQGRTTSFYDSLKRVDGVFTATVQDSGTGGVKRSVDSLWDSLRAVTSKTWKVSVSGGAMGGGAGVRAAMGGIALGNGTLATASRMASGGGIVRTAQKYRGVTVAEAGSPELIVPTRRPLHMVDPLVRPLSAIAQGMALPTNSKPEKKIDASGWTIVTSSDARTAAAEIVNRMAGVGM